MKSSVADHVFYRGEKLQVEFYFTDRGKMPAKEFLDDIPNPKVKGKLMAYAKMIADKGILYDENKYRMVERKERIYEFKIMAYRFFNIFSVGGRLIITNGYMKKSRKANRRELECAARIKKDYLNRIEKGIYYEKT